MVGCSLVRGVLCCVLVVVVCGHNLQELTTAKFDEQIREKQFSLVMFYAPWCGHCKRFKPLFESAGTKLRLENVKLALVDCTQQTELCTRYGVSGYPTVKLFKDGEFEHEFDESRDEKGVMDYLIRRCQEPTKMVTDASQLEEIFATELAHVSPVLVAFIKSEDDALVKIFKKVAAELVGSAIFVYTHSPSVIDVTPHKNHLRLFRPIHIVNKLTPSYVDFNGEFEVDAIKGFVVTSSHGLVGYRSPFSGIFFPPDELAVFYHNISFEMHPKGVNYYRNRLIKLIQDNGLGDVGLTFAYSYSSDYLRELQELGFEDSVFPIVGIRSQGKRYRLDKYGPDLFVQFIKDYKADKLSPYMKSEPVPAEESGVLKKVVASTFDSIVNDPSKDVFMMFHAPWCGHCKQLMPKFEAVAEKLKSEPGLLMVTFDATANDVPRPYHVTGYPTLYFASKTAKDAPRRYEGPREIDDLIKFIAAQSSEELVMYDRKGSKKDEL